jgi:hypothetical protein
MAKFYLKKWSKGKVLKTGGRQTVTVEQAEPSSIRVILGNAKDLDTPDVFIERRAAHPGSHAQQYAVIVGASFGDPVVHVYVAPGAVLVKDENGRNIYSVGDVAGLGDDA